MPTYEYECSKGHLSEKLKLRMMSPDEDPGSVCDACRRVAQRTDKVWPAGVNWEWEMVAMKGEPDVPTRVGF